MLNRSVWNKTVIDIEPHRIRMDLGVMAMEGYIKLIRIKWREKDWNAVKQNNQPTNLKPPITVPSQEWLYH